LLQERQAEQADLIREDIRAGLADLKDSSSMIMKMLKEFHEAIMPSLRASMPTASSTTPTLISNGKMNTDQR
jgi:hypothetical protein